MKYLSRKFIAAIAGEVLFVHLLHVKELNGDQFVTLTQWWWTMFIFGNGVEHLKDKWNGSIGKSGGDH